MKQLLLIILLGLLGFFSSGQSSTTYDVEFSRICLIDSIAPDTINQIWLFTQANQPGAYRRFFTFDLSGSYTPTGTLRPCCSCLTAASDTAALWDPENTTLATGAAWYRRWTVWGAAILALGLLIIRKPEKHTA